MTQREVRVLVERGLHTQGYYRYGNLDPQILNLYLNKGMDAYLDSTLLHLRQVGGGFENSTVAITDLEKLKGNVNLAKETPNVFSSGESYVITAASGDEYRDLIRFMVTVTSPFLSASKAFKVRIYDSEFVDELLNDSLHTTVYNSPVGVIEGGKIKVYTNSTFTLGGGNLLYLKKPAKFDVITKGTEEYPLPNRIVNEVVDRTILLMQRDRIPIMTNDNAN